MISATELRTLSKQLWPRYGAYVSDAMFLEIARNFRAVEYQDLAHAMAAFARAHPDATRPLWDEIRKSVPRETRNDFAAFMNAMRLDKNGAVRPEMRNRTDEELWLAFIDAQVWPIIRCTVGPLWGQFRDDPDGRLRGLEQKERAKHARYWRTYLSEINEPVPTYLQNVER